jgi:hypothetical protein
MEYRNPYVIRAIPFGASREEANIAFARAARRLRRQRDGARYKMTDLTWALNQVDEAITHPQAEMEIYRIPADPAAFTATGGGVLLPPAEVLGARLGDPAAALADLQARAAQEYLRHLVEVRSGQLPAPAP